MFQRRAPVVTLLCLVWACGCSSPATMKVWAPPRMRSAVGSSVVLAKIVGAPARSADLASALREVAPREPGRTLALIAQAQLQQHAGIRLASATDAVPSDVALLHAARTGGHDYVLFGEILHWHDGAIATGGEESPESDEIVGDPAAATGASAADPARLIQRRPQARAPLGVAASVSWRVLDASNAEVVGGMPVTVSEDSIAKQHPDLVALLETQPRRALAIALARDSWSLLTPHVRESSCTLAVPYLASGSRLVRKGNELAEQGQWSRAEDLWRQALEKNPSNHAAMHNLALAAAARQDFVSAKRLAQQALAAHRSGTYERTVVWIEQHQFELAQAFALPPPPEGWLFFSEDRR